MNQALTAGRHPTSWLAMIRAVTAHRRLIWDMARREVIGRYRGSVIGIAWSLLNPLLMLAVYTFVFSVVFQARWATGERAGKAEFAVIVFTGMIIHGLFAECINRAPSLILSNVNYVKKVVFPLEILPLVAMASALFHMFVSLSILLIFHWTVTARFDWTVFWFPLVLLPFVILTLGVAWFLSATGVFVRDIAQTTGLLTTVLMFLSPVLYPASALPEEIRPFLNLNPLTFIIEQARAVLLMGQGPDLAGLAIYTVIALVVARAGYWWFQRTRNGFADVL